MMLISDPTDARALPPTESTGDKIKKALGPIGVIGVVILKFIGKIKFILPILLKTGGSMVLMVGVYASIWGWKWAAGFVLQMSALVQEQKQDKPGRPFPTPDAGVNSDH